MPEDMTIKVEPVVATEVIEAKKEPQLVLEPVEKGLLWMLMPAWNLIAPNVRELAEQSNGEYTENDVFLEIRFGVTDLYMGYIISDVDAYKYMQSDREELKRYSNEEHLNLRERANKMDKEYSGYILLKHPYPPGTDKATLIWQLYVIPKYQHTNIMGIGYKWLEDNVFKKTGVKELSMSGIRQGWHELAPKFGFAESFTCYRKKI